MGAGKTTVGSQVAERLGWSFVDVDALLEARTGCSVGELWQAGGEDVYRPLERDVVAGALRSGGRSVVAAPCDIVVDLDAASALAAADVMAVYLRAQPDCLAARISADDHLHPFLDDRPEDALRTMFVARDHCYERMADHVVDVDELDVEHATTAVLEAICSAGVRLR